MRCYFFAGFFGRTAVDPVGKIAAHKHLRCGILRYAPAVGLSRFVTAVDKIADKDVALRLQARDGGVKALVAAFFIIAELLELLGQYRRVALYQIIQPLIPIRRQPVVITRVKIVAVAPIGTKSSARLLRTPRYAIIAARNTTVATSKTDSAKVSEPTASAMYGNPNQIEALPTWIASDKNQKRVLHLGEKDTRMGKPNMLKMIYTMLTNKAVGE